MNSGRGARQLTVLQLPLYHDFLSLLIIHMRDEKLFSVLVVIVIVIAVVIVIHSSVLRVVIILPFLLGLSSSSPASDRHSY